MSLHLGLGYLKTNKYLVIRVRELHDARLDQSFMRCCFQKILYLNDTYHDGPYSLKIKRELYVE